MCCPRYCSVHMRVHLVLTVCSTTPAGETAEGWQSGEGRAALQLRLQSVVDGYRDADVAAAVEWRRREQRRGAAARGGEDGQEDDGMDEPADARENDDDDGTRSIRRPSHLCCYTRTVLRVAMNS